MDFESLFPDVRESGELPLRQCQLVMIRMFNIFDYLCRKHKIAYFLTGGTLLGAIQYNGFMPYDDDVDVGMTRLNYEKFVRLAAPELPGDIFFQTPQTDKYFFSCGRVEAKLRDRYSSYVTDRQFHIGLQVDIFVYDKAYLPHNKYIYVLNRSIYFLCRSVSVSKKALRYAGWNLKPGDKGNRYRANVLKFISRYAPFSLVYSTSYICTKEMIKLPSDFIEEAEIANLVEVTFEGKKAFVPQGWDACLRRQFGDYKQLIPNANRLSKHSTEIPHPFKPCQHDASLRWEHRKASQKKLPEASFVALTSRGAGAVLQNHTASRLRAQYLSGTQESGCLYLVRKMVQEISE